MHNMHNIGRSGFRRGEYVGYANGVWHIRRIGSGWEAIFPCIRTADYRPRLLGRTLAALSAKLDKFVADATKKGI